MDGQAQKKPAAEATGRKAQLSYASLMRFARGPFWLGSISKLTRSPPASESKFTLESSPVRWKKYSRPSSAAMNPNPRSDTSFLIVPVGICNSSSRKKISRTLGSFREESTTAANIARLPDDEITLPRDRRAQTEPSKGHQGHPDHGRHGT